MIRSINEKIILIDETIRSSLFQNARFKAKEKNSLTGLVCIEALLLYLTGHRGKIDQLSELTILLDLVWNTFGKTTFYKSEG